MTTPEPAEMTSTAMPVAFSNSAAISLLSVASFEV